MAGFKPYPILLWIFVGRIDLISWVSIITLLIYNLYNILLVYFSPQCASISDRQSAQATVLDMYSPTFDYSTWFVKVSCSTGPKPSALSCLREFDGPNWAEERQKLFDVSISLSIILITVLWKVMTKSHSMSHNLWPFRKLNSHYIYILGSAIFFYFRIDFLCVISRILIQWGSQLTIPFQWKFANRYSSTRI